DSSTAEATTSRSRSSFPPPASRRSRSGSAARTGGKTEKRTTSGGGIEPDGTASPSGREAVEAQGGLSVTALLPTHPPAAGVREFRPAGVLDGQFGSRRRDRLQRLQDRRLETAG